jgi:hypothetical protein
MWYFFSVKISCTVVFVLSIFLIPRKAYADWDMPISFHSTKWWWVISFNWNCLYLWEIRAPSPYCMESEIWHRILEVTMPRVLWLKVQKVCMQYQRKFYCITGDTEFSLNKPSQLCLILSQMVASRCKFTCWQPFFSVLCQILDIHSSPVNITLNILGLFTW